MGNVQGHSEIPGAQPWEEYLGSFSSMMENFDQQMENFDRQMESFDRRMTNLEDAIGQIVTGANQGNRAEGAEEASNAPHGGEPSSGSGGVKRPADNNSSDEPKAKRSNGSNSYNGFRGWGFMNGSNNALVNRSITYSGSRSAYYSEVWTENGNTVSWSANRRVSMESQNGSRFLLSNLGNSQLERTTSRNSLIVKMNGANVMILPRSGISFDDIRVSFNNEGRLEIEIPE